MTNWEGITDREQIWYVVGLLEGATWPSNQSAEHQQGAIDRSIEVLRSIVIGPHVEYHA